MADNKKKIVVYADWIDNFEELTDTELGILFRHFFEYVNDRNPVLKDRLLKVAWKPIESTLKRDLKSWNEKASERTEKARIAGLASAEKRRQLKATKSNSLVENELNSTKLTVNDSVNVNVNVNDNDINKRIVGFRKSLLSFVEDAETIHYDMEMVNCFYDYWTEHNPKGKKMRFEYAKNQPFNINRRLTTWFTRQQNFKKEKNVALKKEKTAYEVIQDIKHGNSKS